MQYRQVCSRSGFHRVCVLVLALLCAGCGPTPGRLSDIRERGTLIVLTRNAPTTYYIGRNDRPQGTEYELVKDFAHSLGVKPKFVFKNSIAELLKALDDGEGDMIAAGLTRTPLRHRRFEFGPDYQQVTQQVVCRRDGAQPDSVAELADVDLEVVADSSYVDRLRALRKKHPGLHWRVNATEGTEQLLRKVWAGKLACTVADSDIVAINRRYFPNLTVAFDLSPPQSLAWVLPRGSDALRKAMDGWMTKYRDSGRLQHLMKHYYGLAAVFDYVDTRTYVRRIESVYPEFAGLFLQAADVYDLPPMILAAQSYQESHWRPDAISSSGVRGMMMLTRNTASALGVKNRLDPAASIRGGARYLARMRRRLGPNIRKQDRIWFALAAYNVGLGHVRDARRLTKRLGHDPDRWADVSKVFPLLSESRYYRSLPHGYARGLEPVRYVHRIRNYADILRYRLNMVDEPENLALDDDQ
ncbi:membrane-bound lytic murein transglycosylase MltF [Oleiagrimonas sp. MCCC 1A03011]|jgi:membrane-bound lytic murein transglycosylase F|uniref:membrane-bound lytic murein transglycosylase MltF n=1 Tax=Oleiagrimonas sp. MCCC 1A03011 TaxID=1926883 RepID=UPI000DC294BC|nr:membrane-bound lytic murein transglycosylase MltF [Oleiagrimonas sp. MCCC 1A03011]RAP57714.1 lytic transglycosylase F [Oleiagrimonas sp. MCCC 1A03011]